MASLLITTGQKMGMAFKLDKGPLVAGREVNRDIQILDPKVSRRHFIIKPDDQQIGHVIAQLSARNGVYVNGRRVAEAVLKDGDRIVVGDTQLIYLLNDDPARIDAYREPRQLSPASQAATASE
jgi:pSer/pThr/pTyr-binding forkhead associated (FHA) protein